MKEIWKDIEGYEGMYQVSNRGRIKSLARECNIGRKTKGDSLIGLYKHNGYIITILCKNSIRHTFSVHRLVGKAFIPNPENKPCINHKDENRANNHVDNLEWVTQKENANYGTRNKRAGDKHGKRVIQFDLNGKEIRRWISAAEAGRHYGKSRITIGDACRKHGKCCGYLWRYESEVAI